MKLFALTLVAAFAFASAAVANTDKPADAAAEAAPTTEVVVEGDAVIADEIVVEEKAK